ncbi:ABC transporter permease [candidate division KSB1 bacterium]
MNKIVSIIRKSCKEQLRDFWIFIITITTASIFVFMYYAMLESEKTEYKIIGINNDTGTTTKSGSFINHGDILMMIFGQGIVTDDENILTISRMENRKKAEIRLMKRKAHLLMIIPERFSEAIEQKKQDEIKPQIEFAGNITDVKYLVSAVLAGEIYSQYVIEAAEIELPVTFKETSMGSSGELSDFELYVPGMIIFSIIMLIMTATTAVVRESEHFTLKRLKISNMTTFQLMTGISVVQIFVGVLSVAIAMLAAVLLGYSFSGSVMAFSIIILFTIISMIAFSVLFAAFCKTVTEIMVIGMIPFFILMIFTGAMFKINAVKLFSIGDYDIAVNHILSPTFAVEAVEKVLIYGAGIGDVWFELLAIIILSVFYYFLGIYLFRKRHMGAE